MMRAFARLLDRLAFTPSRNAKLTLMRDYFRETPDPERGWALAALTGALSFDAAKPAFIRKAVEGADGRATFRAVLRLCRRPGRDGGAGLAGEARRQSRDRSCPKWSTRCAARSRRDVQRLLEGWLDALDADGRWALLKLLTGGLRVGVSARLAKQALADTGRCAKCARSRRSGTAQQPPYEDLFAWLEGRSEKPIADAPGRFRPVMLAQAHRRSSDFAKLDPADYAAEWKWDGIRVQAVSERGVRRLYSRTGDDIGAAFPDVIGGAQFRRRDRRRVAGDARRRGCVVSANCSSG